MRESGYRSGMLRPSSVGVPVVVVGNLYVGGTGKTPLTLELAQSLRVRGWHPCIVASGYGRSGRDVDLVEPGAKAAEVGDEPLLMARTSGVPVVVGRDRVAACRILRGVHPRCDVILTDDGLQDRSLTRNFDIALIDERGLGNGWLLPAGPLRDPPSRLMSIDATVFHGATPTVRIYSPRFEMRTQLGGVHSLADPTRAISIDGLVQEQQRGQLRILAAAGIGVPARFFAMLRAAGLQIDELPLPDHYDFVLNPFQGRTFDLALITAKDAVKCSSFSAIATDGRICVVELKTSVDPGLIDLIEARIAPNPEKVEHGRTAA